MIQVKRTMVKEERQEDLSVKIPANVVCACYASGHIQPLFVLWPDGKRYKISEVVGLKPVYAEDHSAYGMCYTCRIGSQKRDLYFENSRWYIDAVRPV